MMLLYADSEFCIFSPVFTLIVAAQAEHPAAGCRHPRPAWLKTSQNFNWKVWFKLETYITHGVETPHTTLCTVHTRRDNT